MLTTGLNVPSLRIIRLTANQVPKQERISKTKRIDASQECTLQKDNLKTDTL